MQLKKIYELAVEKGIKEDIRGQQAIKALLKKKSEELAAAGAKERDFFDKDSLFNPFSDTRILNGDTKSEIKSIIAGIDVETAEFLLVDRLKEKGEKIDLVISHHPQGRAFANFYEVMDLQVDAYCQEGLSLSFVESQIEERKSQVGRKVHAANHLRSVDAAKMLGINFLCIHTAADNCAFQFVKKIIGKEKPANLGAIIDILYGIPEYKDAAKNNNPPKIILGRSSSKVSKVHIEFTGGTEGPESVYNRLSLQGVDTVISMHQSEEHVKKCKESNMNVIFASHIASDTLGMNLIIDYLESKEKFTIYEFSGFRRFKRKNG